MPINHEQKLVTNFMNLIWHDDIYGVKEDEIYNFNCKAKKYADVEYITKKGIRMVIEAKSHHSPDRHNSLHKIFGELLKEAFRHRDKLIKSRYCLLVPLTRHEKVSGEEFYRSKIIEYIGMTNLNKFSKIIPMSYVFACSNKELKMYGWLPFFNNQDCCWEWSFA
jgi:hypothetical protein